MSDTSLISVVMPAYNAEATLAEAMGSALTQTHSEIELVMVDDCSTDETLAVAEDIALHDSRVQVLRNEANLGTARTRLRAVEEARSNWIAILDADDAWLPTKLKRQVDLQAQMGADIIYTGSSFMDETGAENEFVLRVPERITYTELLRQNLISNSSVLVRKDLWLSHTMLCDDIHEDYACWLGMLRDGATACGIDEPLLRYRVSRASKSGNKLQSARMNWRTYRAVGIGPVASAWYMVHYTMNGMRKWRSIARGRGDGGPSVDRHTLLQRGEVCRGDHRVRHRPGLPAMGDDRC